MFSVNSLRSFFSSPAQSPLLADNENHRNIDDVLKQIFTTSEMMQVYGLVKPYMENGPVGEMSLKKGDGASSLVILHNNGQWGHNVIFSMVKYKRPSELATYKMNFPATRLNLETLNFSELVRECRAQMTALYGAPKTPEFRIV